MEENSVDMGNTEPQEGASGTPSETPTPTPTLAELLDKADADELRRHPRFAGIVGSEIQRREQGRQADYAKHQAQQREDDIIQLLSENEDWVKQHYPRAHEYMTTRQQERAAEHLESLRGQTLQGLAEQIGQACAALPEWKDLTTEDHEQLARAVIGKSDSEVIAVFNQKAIDLVAERRARTRLSEWTQKELQAARDAIRQEEAAKLMQNDIAPDNSKPKGRPQGVNISAMSDKEFTEYWNNHIKK